MLVLLLTHLASAYVGRKNLTTELYFEWNFAETDSVQFSVGVNSSLYSNTKWVGIGLNSASGKGTMAHSDIVSFILKDDSNCKDRWAETNGYPLADNIASVICLQKKKVGTFHVYSWKRKLNTNDPEDFSLQNVMSARVLWALGEVNHMDGTLYYHGRTAADRGSTLVSFEAAKSGSNRNLSAVLALIIWIIF